MEAGVAAPDELLVHLSTDPSYPTHLFVSDGTVTETLQIITNTGEACVHARLEDAVGNLGEWFADCEAVEAPADDDDGDGDGRGEPYKPSRCQAAPAPRSGVLALAGLLGLARRRSLR